MAAPNYWKTRLGRELAELRVAAGLRQEDAGVYVERTQSRIAQIEKGTGKGVVDLPMLRALALCYGAEGTTVERLVQLREFARTNGWWSTYRLPGWLAEYVRLEAGATRVCELQLEVVPGLLQTPDYARTLHRVRGVFTPAEVERRTEIRMQRQRRLTGPDPLGLAVVVSESALMRCRGCGEMGAAQLRQLAERSRWPNVELRVLPFRLGLHGSMTGTFTLLEFPDGLLPPLVYQEYPVGGHLIEADGVVDQMLTLFGELQDQALGADDSLALLMELCR